MSARKPWRTSRGSAVGAACPRRAIDLCVAGGNRNDGRPAPTGFPRSDYPGPGLGGITYGITLLTHRSMHALWYSHNGGPSAPGPHAIAQVLEAITM